MRKYKILKSALAMLTVSYLCSCSSMNSLTIPVTEPAPVYLSSSVKSVGILDRSLPTEKTSKMDDLDKYLSIEGKNFDKDAAGAAVVGLFDELKQNSRFENLKIIENSALESPGMGVFPSPISWQQVGQLCEENDVDAIFMLSFYDTDANVDFGYRFNEKFSFFIKGSNLIGDNYQKWANYKVQGIQVLLGASYKFDW